MKKVGIIGFGNMGSSIAQRLKANYKVFIFDKKRAKTKNISKIKVANSITDLVGSVEVIILAVKPQDFELVLSEIKNSLKEKLIISIAAGIPTKYIEKKLGKVKVIRAMPNLGAKIGSSVTCLCKGKFSSKGDLLFTRKLFNCIGSTKILSENKMNAVTAISGSGPAYVCYSIETGVKRDNFLTEFKNAAKAVGFNSKEADFLVNKTFACTINVLKKKKIKPIVLRKQVTSRGGTTEAALKVLIRGGSLKTAAKAALKRAEELSK